MKPVNPFYTLQFNLILFILFLFPWNQAMAQIEIEEEPRRLYYDRTMRINKFKDMKDMRDVLHKDKLLLGKNRITGNISYNTGRVLVDDGHEVHNEIRSAIGFFTRIRFFEQFSFNTTFYKDFNPRAAAPWTSNYTYSIGRYNWKPNKFNYGYENYLNNRYTDNADTFWQKFLEGYYFVSYNHNLSEQLTNKIKLDESTNLKFIYFARYAIRYKDGNEISHGDRDLIHGKPSGGVGVRYTIVGRIYIESAVYYYVFPSQKQAWDPDYSYGFGYFDWRSFRCSLTYGNWAINRFPWNKKSYPNYGFLDGNFRFIVNWIW